MNSDPAVVAAATIANSIKGSCPLPHELAQVIREAYAPTLAAKDAEIERLTRRNAELTVSEENMASKVRVAEANRNMVCGLNQQQDRYITDLKADRDRLSVEVERLQRELAAAHEESAKRGSEILDLQQENAELRRDAERLKYVEENHVRSHSPHMDGTFGWSFRGLLNGCFQTFREAIDAAMKEAK